MTDSFVEIFANVPNSKSVVSFDVCKKHFELISGGATNNYSIGGTTVISKYIGN
jgi:hypothetical protein